MLFTEGPIEGGDRPTCGRIVILPVFNLETGVFGADDTTSGGTLETAHARGFCVPGDGALAGRSGFGLASWLDSPRRPSATESGTTGPMPVVSRFLRNPAGMSSCATLPTELVIRLSAMWDGRHA